MKFILISLYIILLTLLTGCNNSTDTDEHEHEETVQEGADVHDHQSEEVKLIITSYSKEFEVFAEADPFVINEESSILAHFTKLDDFKPLENASVNVTLLVDGKSTSQKLEKPTRKGIYNFTLNPDFEGNGKLIFAINDGKSTFKVEVDNIVVYKDDHMALHEAEETQIESPNGIKFTKEQSWKVDFMTEKIEFKPISQVVKTVAKIVSAPSDELTVSAKSSGIVIITSDSFTDGSVVKTGQNLLTISGNELADNNSKVRYAEAESNYNTAKANFDRNKELVKDKIVSEKEYQQSENEYENAKAIFDNLKKNFSLNGQIITSPLNGTINRIFISNGQFVNAGDPILLISKNQKLKLEANVQSKYFNHLKSFESANIRLIEKNKTYTLNQLNGKLISIGNSTGSSSFLIPVSFQIDYNPDFILGGFVELNISTKTNENGISIPNSALIEEQGYFSVFVQLTPELFEKREVIIGSTDGFYSQVLDGLTEGERIVTKGAILIKLASASNNLDPHAGHVH